jgi:hypothetical protein
MKNTVKNVGEIPSVPCIHTSGNKYPFRSFSMFGLRRTLVREAELQEWLACRKQGSENTDVITRIKGHYHCTCSHLYRRCHIQRKDSLFKYPAYVYMMIRQKGIYKHLNTYDQISMHISSMFHVHNEKDNHMGVCTWRSYLSAWSILEALDWLGILDARKCDRGLLAG